MENGRNQRRNFKKKYLETNENRSKNFQNLMDTAKAVLGGKFIVIQALLKKQEKHQVNN